MFVSKVLCSSMENYCKRKEHDVDLNFGGKLILPHRCLNEIVNKCQGELPNPMQFKVTNERASSKPFTHCGVIDFSNSSPNAFIPSWVMKQLGVSNKDEIKIELSYLPVGTYARLKPLSPEFKNITEPIVVLEICLRQYSCLTVGDIMTILYNNKIFEFKVEDLKPYTAVNIIECDMNVEFAMADLEGCPLKKRMSEEDAYDISPEAIMNSRFVSFSGVGQRLDGKNNKINTEENAFNDIPRGIPNYEYSPGSLNFYRKGVLQDGKDEIPNRDEDLIPFSGKGLTMK